ncbi:hypothetical protein JOF53_006636 [Crossiella equi]|uniref:Uncharacterized protein n=1 Tax=Crossiella equi TaxID=130796 RepID=A0ABS5AMH0_9PSEU|nr:hypothetical protein [Crossiella equi]MBP2477764.1 hypothetical protein [Crossiella equi]
MSKRHPPEACEKAVRPALERLDEFESPCAGARAIGPMVDVRCETSRGLLSAEREELPRPRKEVRDPQQANKILTRAWSSLARELDPRHH